MRSLRQLTRRMALPLGLALLSGNALADTWAPMATISGTTSLVTNSLCYTDGQDILCNGTGAAIVSGGGSSDRITSGTTSVIATSSTSITFTTAGTQRMIIGSTGGIGIGAAPADTFALNIIGKLRLTTATGENTFIGNDVAVFATNTTNNTVIGSGALVYGDNTSGITAIGQSAAFSTGSVNLTAVGLQAGQYNNGDYSTLLGAAAGVNNKGPDAVIVGADAGNGNTSGYVTLMGNSAARSNTASGTTALGWNSLYGNTSGLANTAVGYSSARTNQTGSYNTSVGYSAGMGSGSNNSANTFLGAYTGTAITTGGSNTIIGANSGMTLTTGSSNILIGAGVTPVAATGSGQLSIGNAIFGNIGYGTTNRNRIGINVTSPTTNLEVSGTISATQFVGDGSLLTGIAGGGTSDRITSSTTAAVVANQTGGTVSFTLGSTAGAAYLHPTLGLVAKGVSTTGPISASSVMSQGRATFNGGLVFNQGTAGTDNLIYVGGNGAGTTNQSFGFFVAPSGSSGSIHGPYFLGRGNDFGTTQRGNMYFVSGGVSSPNTYEGSIQFMTGPSTNSEQLRMAIDYNGNIGIGTPTSRAIASKLEVVGTTSTTALLVSTTAAIGATSPGAYTLYIAGNAYTTGSWSTSDARFKENIQPMSGLLAKVNELRPVNFTWKKTAFAAKDNPGEQIGLIAQEVEKVYPELVKTNSDGYKAVAYDKLSVLLLGAVKDLKTENDALKAQISKQNEAFEARLRKLEAANAK